MKANEHQTTVIDVKGHSWVLPLIYEIRDKLDHLDYLPGCKFYDYIYEQENRTCVYCAKNANYLLHPSLPS